MDYKNNKGFTLIEMMVVIAVIGILSAAVLAGIAPGRQKARDVRVISALKQIQIVIESTADVGGYSVDAMREAGAARAMADIDSVGGIESAPHYANDANNYAVWAKLPSGAYYCVDSGGVSKTVSEAPGDGVKVCP